MSRTVLLALALLAVSAGCHAEPASRPATRPVISVVDADEFEQLRKTHGYLLLDVRTPAENAAGRIPGSKLIDINSEDFDKQVAALDRDKPILVYCRSGRRSAVACERMSEAGFARLYELRGGIMAWEKAGKEVEK